MGPPLVLLAAACNLGSTRTLVRPFPSLTNNPSESVEELLLTDTGTKSSKSIISFLELSGFLIPSTSSSSSSSLMLSLLDVLLSALI